MYTESVMKRKATNKKTHEDTKRIAFPIQLFSDTENDVELSDTMHVVPVGEWDHPIYGEMKITTDDVQEFISNFKAKVRRDLPITAGHDNGMGGGELPAIGWFIDLIDRGVNGLYAVVEWTAEGKTLLKERAFKYFSPEFYEDYEDPETRAKYRHVLVGGALTNSPYFKELEPVVAFSDKNIFNQFNESSNMNLNELLAKKVSELSDEEKTFIRDHKDELNDDQKESHKEIIDESGDGSDDGEGSGDGAGDGNGDGEGDDGKGEGEGEGSGDGKGKGEGEGEGDDGEGEGQKNASDKKGRYMSEAEIKVLSEKANSGQKAFNELESMKISSSVEKMVFSESNASGHILPKQKDAVVSFVKSLSEKQRDQFINIVNNMPKMQIFGEVGDGGGNTNDVSKELETAVQSKIKASENTLKYAQALKEVFAENPDLEKRYTESIEIA